MLFVCCFFVVVLFCFPLEFPELQEICNFLRGLPLIVWKFSFHVEVPQQLQTITLVCSA